LPGGYGATYGRGLGGLITVATRDPDTKRLHGAVQVDLLDASVSGSGKLADGWTFAAAARRSHLDDTLAAVTNKDVGEFFPSRTITDGQLKLRRVLSPKALRGGRGLLSSDSVSRNVGSADPAERKQETKELHFSAFTRATFDRA